MSYTAKTPTNIFALGGLEEVGKNMYVIEHDNDVLVIDLGIKFASEEMLGMNGLIPNFSYFKTLPKNAEINVIITHGHEDHIGGIPYFLKEVKNVSCIYAPLLASELIKKKLSEFKGLKIPEIKVYDRDCVVKTKYFEIDFFRVCHSIPDSHGICVKSPNGIITSAGDYRFDFDAVCSLTDMQKISEISKRGVDVFLSESTNSEHKGFSESESTILSNILNIIKSAKGRVFVSTFASNIGRISYIIEEAIKMNKKICLLGRSMENNIKISRKINYINFSETDLITHSELNNYQDNELLIILTGSQGEAKAALSKIASNGHQKISIKPSDTIILSSNPIPGNFVAVETLVNNLYKTGAKVFTHSNNFRIHASGHATAQEQQLMISLMNPNYIVPIHGEYKMFRRQCETANQTGHQVDKFIIVKNGQKVQLLDHVASATDVFVKTDPLYVDGKVISKESHKILAERSLISSEGFFNVILILNKNSLAAMPKIVTRGCFYVRDSLPMLIKISCVLESEINAKLKELEKNNFSEKEIKETVNNLVKTYVKNYVWKNKKRNPLIFTTIFMLNEQLNV